jgi:hypothetical protein
VCLRLLPFFTALFRLSLSLSLSLSVCLRAAHPPLAYACIKLYMYMCVGTNALKMVRIKAAPLCLFPRSSALALSTHTCACRSGETCALKLSAACGSRTKARYNHPMRVAGGRQEGERSPGLLFCASKAHACLLF